MPDALAIAAGIMAEDMRRLQVVSQNLANAGTAGYKSSLVVSQPFVEHLRAAGPNGGAALPLNLPLAATRLDFRPGAMTQTGRPLDVAIEGGGFFELAGSDGPLYTRQGAFRLDARGRLVNPAGLPVNGLGGEIVLTGERPVIDRQGQVSEGERVVAQLKVVTFADPAGLVPMGGGVYRARSAAEVASEPLQVRQGYLESSNVVTLAEMMRVVEVVRRFGAAQRIVQNYDGMLGGAIRTLGEF